MSPAGDWDAMRAAVANGADAVYFGLGNFNARHRATNFTLEELPRIMQYLHGHNVKGFLTFNTLVFSDELNDAVNRLQHWNAPSPRLAMPDGNFTLTRFSQR
jgi:putative protease